MPGGRLRRDSASGGGCGELGGRGCGVGTGRRAQRVQGGSDGGHAQQLGLVTAGLGVALVPDIILNAAKHDDVATLSLSPASHRQILAVTTPDLLRVPAVAAAMDALCAAAGADPAASPAQLAAAPA